VTDVHIVETDGISMCGIKPGTFRDMALTLASAEAVASHEGRKVCVECETEYLDPEAEDE
jgi:hypothetical protein